MIFVIRRYTPTKEHMSLSDYFTLTEENQAAVILNGEYKEVSDSDDAIYAIATDQGVYLEISFLKSNLDDGYVYDMTEGVLRYVTDQDVVSASLNSDAYTVGKSRESLGKDVVVSQNGAYFVSADFVKLYTDMSFELFDSPNRVVIETAGYEKKVASLKRDAALRRFGGVKSKILKDAKKGDQLTILENYGKWSHVLTEDGVLACVQNRRLSKSERQTVEATLPERTYNHITVKDPIVMGWHQVTSQSANSGVSQVVAGTDLNVISPTWFSLSDNLGNIKSLASSDYVTYCHQNNIQVWGLVSNLENKNVDTTTVLNTTSYRDNLVNNLITQAISYDLDGINVDMEALSVSAKDGYIEFIKELSIKCEKNDIILSVDDYVPSASTAFYNRSVQADYADYIAVMAYDEHYVKGPEAGSDNHVGILCGKTDAGDWIAVHCSSSKNGVTVGEAYSASFRYIRQPSFYPNAQQVEEMRQSGKTIANTQYITGIDVSNNLQDLIKANLVTTGDMDTVTIDASGDGTVSPGSLYVANSLQELFDAGQHVSEFRQVTYGDGSWQ